jgi:hypothetical protein
MTDVWVYQGKELRVFASAEAAQKWFDENDPEGVAFKCEVEGEEKFEPMPSLAPGC